MHKSSDGQLGLGYELGARNGYVNYVKTKSGSVRAVCECCGRKSKPVRPGDDGEPSVWSLPIGWSEAPYPRDSVHHDGSTGSLYKCPSCNKKLKAGHSLKVRDYDA